MGDSLSTATTDTCLDYCSGGFATALSFFTHDVFYVCFDRQILADIKGYLRSHPGMYYGGYTGHGPLYLLRLLFVCLFLFPMSGS